MACEQSCHTQAETSPIYNAHFMIYSSGAQIRSNYGPSWGVLEVAGKYYVAEPENRGRLAALQLEESDKLQPGFTNKKFDLLTRENDWRKRVYLSPTQFAAFNIENREEMELVAKYLRRHVGGMDGCKYVYKVPGHITKEQLDTELRC